MPPFDGDAPRHAIGSCARFRSYDAAEMHRRGRVTWLSGAKGVARMAHACDGHDKRRGHFFGRLWWRCVDGATGSAARANWAGYNVERWRFNLSREGLHTTSTSKGLVAVGFVWAWVENATLRFSKSRFSKVTGLLFR